MNIAKFLRTPFLWNTSGRLLLKERIFEKIALSIKIRDIAEFMSE